MMHSIQDPLSLVDRIMIDKHTQVSRVSLADTATCDIYAVRFAGYRYPIIPPSYSGHMLGCFYTIYWALISMVT